MSPGCQGAKSFVPFLTADTKGQAPVSKIYFFLKSFTSGRSLASKVELYNDACNTIIILVTHGGVRQDYVYE